MIPWAPKLLTMAGKNLARSRSNRDKVNRLSWCLVLKDRLFGDKTRRPLLLWAISRALSLRHGLQTIQLHLGTDGGYLGTCSSAERQNYIQRAFPGNMYVQLEYLRCF